MLKGVARFGIGNWTKILKCSDFNFRSRTALDLKDRFRVCCPDDYKTIRSTRLEKPVSSEGQSTDLGAQDSTRIAEAKRGRKPERKSRSQLHELGIDEDFAKVSRRKRTAYSPAEDAALLIGFTIYGKSWTAIQQDPNLGLSNRTATDLRDRMRTKYPEDYEKAGLAPRAAVFPNPPERSNDEGEDCGKESNEVHVNEHETAKPAADDNPSLEKPSNVAYEARTGKESEEANPAAPKKAVTLSSFPLDDIFLDLQFDMEDEAERVTLDRRILDWPSDFGRTPANGASSNSIDSLAVLNLPKPTTSAVYLDPSTAPVASASGALPSLATITAGSNTDDVGEQLGLPSLMAGFGAFDVDGADSRTGANLMSMDEWLKTSAELP